MQKLLLPLSIILLITISCSDETACEISQIKFLGSTRVIGASLMGVDTSYYHDVLLEGYNRICLDSITIVDITKKYLDTISFDLPVSVIRYFNSEQYYNYDGFYSRNNVIADDALLNIAKDPKGQFHFSFHGDSMMEAIYSGPSFTEGKKKLFEYHGLDLIF